MPSTTVRISERTRERLHEMSENTGESMQSVLDKAVETYRRIRFLREANASYARAREEEGRDAGDEEERRLWDQTLMDGLDPGEEWPEGSRLGKVRKGERRGARSRQR